MGKQCALCYEDKTLELSHIVPKFVMRYLKKTSVGAIRNMENPNAVVQDSEKHYLLCGDCEDLFSTYETKFANEFFHPYLSGNKKIFHYDKDTFYFLTSVSWRSLYLDILDFVEHSEQIGIGKETLDCLIEREREMRNYLLNKQTTVPDVEHHIFFYEEIKDISRELIETRPHTTIHRSITSYTFFNEEFKTYATVTNMLGIILFTLYRKGEQEYWENTEIVHGDGVIKAENQQIKSICGNELTHILQSVKASESKLSDKQREAIENRFKNREEEFKKSKAFEDLKKDFNL